MAKQLEPRLSAVEEQVGSLRTDLQRLGPMEQNLSWVMEKLSILDRVEKALQRLETPVSQGASTVMEGSSSGTRPGSSTEPGKEKVTAAEDAPGPGAVQPEEKPDFINRGDLGIRRLEMPLFEGENPEGWIFRVERYLARS